MESERCEKMSIDAKAALTKDQANYNSLKASCDGKKQARVQAQSLLDSAESAWSTRKEGSMQETCLAAPGIDVCFRHQGERRVLMRIHKVVAATKQARGTNSERETEWMASQASKCLNSQVHAEGFEGSYWCG